jgi:hypothetical protein
MLLLRFSFVLVAFFLVFQCNLVAQAQPNYAKIYAQDYQKATDFVQKEQAKILAAAQKYELEPKAIMAIVFPELIRYNAFRDFFEAGALEYAYIYQGTTAADFSIGFFQIKPSFVEQIEALVKANPQQNWARPFVEEFKYSFMESKVGSAERRRRHERLQSIDWQLKYLCCFYRYVSFKFAEPLKKLSPTEQIRFIATTYNAGFNHSAESIMKRQKQRFFPDGIAYPQKDQYNYADVSIYAYQKTLPAILGKK